MSSPSSSSPREILARSTLFTGPVWRVESMTVRTKGGSTADRYIVRHPGAVVIVPIMDDGRLVLIRNHRMSVGLRLWEFCAGTLESGEDPAACAARELREETGFRAAAWRFLGRFYTTPGVTDQQMHVFLARDLEFVGQSLMEDEDIQTDVKTVGEVWSMIDQGELIDAKSIVALVMYQRAAQVPSDLPR